MSRELSGHISGPWAVDGPSCGYVSIRDDPNDWDGKGYTHICRIPLPTKKDAHFRAPVIASAVLMATSPELLEALVEMTALAEGPPGGVTVAMKRAVIAKAHAAIKKATGEPSWATKKDAP